MKRRVIICCFLAAAFCSSLSAGVLTVTSSSDSGQGSLRAAVELANTTPEPDSIVIGNGVGPIVLTSGELVVSAPLRILGAAAGSEVSANGASRSFRVLPSAESVILENLLLTDGRAQGLADFSCDADSRSGGAVCSLADLELVNTVFENNQSESAGGAVFVFDANLTISSSVFRGNSTSGNSADGGAVGFLDDIFTEPHQLQVSNSTFENNATLGEVSDGGAIGAADGEVYIESSLFEGNSVGGGPAGATSGAGGAIYIRAADAFLDNVIVRDNSSVTGFGGGLALILSPAVIQNSTFSGNSTDDNGGGIRAEGRASFQLINSTVSGNLAGNQGGGVALYNATQAWFYNSTITDNASAETDAAQGLWANAFFALSPVTSYVYLDSTIVSGNGSVGPDWVRGGFGLNLVFLETRHSLLGSGFSAPGGSDVFALNPGLGPLADNGCARPAGFPETAECVQTHLPLPTSPALSVGLNPLNLPFDQRGEGFPRQIASGPSIGAVTVPNGFVDEVIPVPLLESKVALFFLCAAFLALALTVRGKQQYA